MCLLFSPKRHDMSQPNIILCTCDQLRAFEVGCYGNSVIRTPNIDHLAGEGVRFETAVTNFPVCMAARSGLLSGQYNRSCTGGVGNVGYPSFSGDCNMPEYPFHGRPHLKDPTLAETLRGQGYHTATIGKWHIHSWPHDIGFDYYLIPRVHHCHTGQHFTENGGAEFIAPGYSVDFEAERVARFLEQCSRSKQPFFLYYNISPPHCPISDAPDKYTKLYAPETIPIRPNVNLDERLADQEHWFKVYRWDFRYYSFHLPYTEELPADFRLRDIIALYYGMTTWVDDTLGRLLAALEATGLAENTIVLFTSDHGDNLGSHGLVQKGSPNEEAIRIPLLLRWPKLGRESTVIRQQVASLVDLTPTLLSLAGIPVPEHIQGRTLTPILRGERQAVHQAHAFVETGDGAAIRTVSHMYFLPFCGQEHTLADTPTQFYDLGQDPYQLNNLAGRRWQEETGLALDTRLRQWHQTTPWMVDK